MMDQVSMQGPKSMLHPKPINPDTATTPLLYLYSLLTLIPSETTHATFDHHQLIDLAAPPVV